VRAGYLFLLLMMLSVVSQAAPVVEHIPFINDVPASRDIPHPDWFKKSFLDLRVDLKDARKEGKQGVIVYFGQENCPYCLALMKENFGRPDITRYTRAHFDVIAIDIWGSLPVVLPDGRKTTEREYALQEKTNFTPSLIFYDPDGKVVLRLRGYYPPYRFRAALHYVAEGYYKHESLRDYLARAENTPKFELGDLNQEDFFSPPPYALDRSHFPASKPLVVFFEQRDCHACDILHGDPLQHEKTRELMQGFEAVQLDMWADTPVLTPDGRHETAKSWASRLGIFYAPTLVFFDEKGKEIIRIDSVVGLYRLQGVLQYVLEKGYLEYPTYQKWRQQQRAEVPEPPAL
jgi:thioredoxin-related protein